MNKLIFVPTPLTEESPHSLIKRTAQRHGFSTTGKLNGLCIGPQTFRSISLTQDSDFAKLFVAEAGINGPRVLEGFYATIDRPAQLRRAVINEVEIPVVYLRVRSGAYCDDCFNQGWERQIQDFKLAEFCPYHLKKYLTHCPECRMPIEWWHALDGKCRYCCAALKCQPCTFDMCRLERMLLDLLRSRNQLDFDRLFALTRQLGYTPEKPRMPDATRRMVFIGAFSIMTDDSRVILEHLFKLKDIYPDVEKRWIAARFILVATDAMREASRIFLETKNQSLHISDHSHEPFLLTLRQLRAFLNLSNGQMIKIKKNSPFAFKKVNACFTADEATVLAKKANEFLLADDGRLPIPKNDLWSSAKVRNELSISPATLKSYVQFKLLKPYLGYKRSSFFFPSDIKQFSMLYVPVQNLSKKTGLSARKLCAILYALDIKIIPNCEVKFRLRLIEKTEVNRIITASTIKSKKPYQRLVPPCIELSKSSRTDYRTIHETAKELQTCEDNAVAIIRKNILKGVCRGKKGILLIPKTEIQNFKNNFMTTAQAAKAIKIHPTRAPDLLFGLGVHAVTGPIMDDTRYFIYRAVDILRVAKLAEAENPSEHFNYYSITSAATRLHITTETLSKLMATGLITYIQGKVGAYFKPSWLDNFKLHFVMPSELLKLAALPTSMTLEIIDALRDINVTPISFKLDDQYFHIYEQVAIRNSYDAVQKILTDLGESKKNKTLVRHINITPPAGCTPVRNLIKYYNISMNEFSNLFIHFGFINVIIHNQERYLSDNDRRKCAFILDNYCTRTIAGKITPGGYCKITLLLNSGILEKEQPIPAKFTQTTLISRCKLKKYLDSLPVSAFADC